MRAGVLSVERKAQALTGSVSRRSGLVCQRLTDLASTHCSAAPSPQKRVFPRPGRRGIAMAVQEA